MRKITEGSKWKIDGFIIREVRVLYVHEKGVMFEYNDGMLMAYSIEEFLDRCTPIRKTHEVFRLWKFLESNELTSKDKAEAVWNGYPQKLEGKTQEEMKDEYDLNDAWLVEEEIK